MRNHTGDLSFRQYSTMNCQQARIYQGPYLDSELDPTATYEVSHHLENCSDCTQVFKAHERLERAIDRHLRRVQGDEGEVIERSLELVFANEDRVLACSGESGDPFPPPPRSQNTTRQRRGFRASPALLMIAGAAALIILSVTYFTPQRTVENAPAGNEGTQDGHWSSALVVIHSTGVDSRELYETNEGLVEQVTALDWVTVAQVEPTSGDRVTWSANELTIEAKPPKKVRKR